MEENHANGPGSRPSGNVSAHAAKWIIDRLSPDALFTCLTKLGASSGGLFKGFKVSRRAAGRKVVRGRLAQELPRIPELAETLLELGDGPWKHWRGALACLDAAWLSEEWCALARHYGPDVVAAMAVDAREPVRARGWRMLARDSYWERWLDAPSETAESDVPAELGALFAAADVATASSVAQPMADTEAKDKAIAKLEKERDELGHQRDRAKRKARDAEVALDELRAQLQSDAKDAKRRMRELAASNEQLRADVEREVCERVDDFRRRVLGLTPEFQELCAKWAPGEGRALTDRVDAALAEQRQVNDRHGTVASIRDEIARLEKAKEQIGQAVQESVVVVPGLDKLSSEVMDRLAHLRGLLGVGKDETPVLAASLMEQIAAADPGPEGDRALDDIRLLLSVPAIGRVLSEKWLVRIRQEADHKKEATERALKENREAAIPDVCPTDGRRAFPREILSIDRELSSLIPGRKAHLFVDGYNVTKTVPHFQAIEESQDLGAARRELCDMCRSKADQFASFELVFDGSQSVTTREMWGNVTVVFAARRREDQNADDCIVDLIREQQTGDDEIWLVTNDYGLRARLKWHCTAFARTPDLYTFLAE